MMNKKETSHRSIWKYTLILPVVATLLFFNSAFQTKAEAGNEMNYAQQAPAKAQDKPVAASQQTPQKAQDKPVTTQKARVEFTPPKKPAKDSKGIYDHVEAMPEFPGGDAALLKWLQDNVKYPVEAQEKGIQGTVYLRFVVTPDGSVDNVEVVKSSNPILDEEAVRAIKTMPKFTPGKQDGKPVYVYYQVPVRFKMEDKKTNKPVSKNKQDAAVVELTDIKEVQKVKAEPATVKGTRQIYNHVEVMPQFPGGDAALLKWLSENIKYPEEAKKQGIQGTVHVRFVVTPDGSVDDVEVVKGLDPVCDRETLRVLKTVPKFTPGTQNGNPVYVYYQVPVRFKL